MPYIRLVFLLLLAPLLLNGCGKVVGPKDIEPVEDGQDFNVNNVSAQPYDDEDVNDVDSGGENTNTAPAVNVNVNTNANANANLNKNKNTNTPSNTNISSNKNTNNSTNVNTNTNTNKNTNTNQSNNTNTSSNVNTNANVNANVNVNVNANTNSNANTNTNTNTNSNTNSSASRVKTFSITAENWKFTPSTIKVKKGDQVKVTISALDNEHGFSIPAFNVNVSVAPGSPKTVEFTASQSGNFSFFCSVFCGSGHSEMTGTLVVEE